MNRLLATLFLSLAACGGAVDDSELSTTSSAPDGEIAPAVIPTATATSTVTAPTPIPAQVAQATTPEPDCTPTVMCSGVTRCLPDMPLARIAGYDSTCRLDALETSAPKGSVVRVQARCARVLRVGDTTARVYARSDVTGRFCDDGVAVGGGFAIASDDVEADYKVSR